jgi:dienelactone hydrolase
MAEEQEVDESAIMVRRRNFSPWFQWVSRLMETEALDPMPINDRAAFVDWRERCRERLEELLGQWPIAVPLELEVLEAVECDGYRRLTIVFDTEDTMSVPAYLLVPDGRSEPGPAVLAAHGHGPGKGQTVGLEFTETPGSDYGHQLAQRGYVVLAPDLRCFGQRQDWNPDDHYACDTNLVHAVMAGWNPLTQNLWDLMRCLDVLTEHPLVDASRIGMVGHSYGGTVALFLAALDDRVAVSVVSGYFSSWAEAHKVPWNMCGSQVLFDQLGVIEHVDLAGLIAPRPLLIESGTEDLLFPVGSARDSVGQLRRVFELLEPGSAHERLVHDVFEGDHQFHGVRAYPFFDRWL